ncbi:MAG: hypothetical protein ACI8TX_001530 [Hyphomicrobiaceae bacterium]
MTGTAAIAATAQESVRRLLVEFGRDFERFQAPADAAPLLERVRSRITRDLLPRLESEPDFAVVGIVGPNNSGKSTLFSAIAAETGSALSPSSPTGGFTRVLVGAVNPKVEDTVRRGLSERFDVEYLGSAIPDAGQVHRTADPQRLLLVDSPVLPPWLVFIDTPDFDSVFRENRAAGDALLLTADLLVIVVTPQTYQNLGVVEFLRHAIAGGRPFVLVYNEGSTADIARRHLDKLSADLGRSPMASFLAVHDIAVQEGALQGSSAALVPIQLDSTVPTTLGQWLFERSNFNEAMRDAWITSTRALVGDLTELESVWEQSTREPQALHHVVYGRLDAYARTVTRSLFPVAPFREALQAQLDKRSPLHRALRYVPERVGGVVRGGYDSLRRVFVDADEVLSSSDRFQVSEREQLLGPAGPDGGGARNRELLRLWESLAGDVHTHHGAVSDGAVSSDFGSAARASLSARLTALHEQAPLPFQDFRAECERSIDAELDTRGEEAGLQWAYTGLKLLPPVTAVAVMAMTGVVGDVGAGVAYLATEPFLHKAVGREFVARIHDAWSNRRSVELVNLLGRGLAPRCIEELHAAVQGQQGATSLINSAAKKLEELLP